MLWVFGKQTNWWDILGGNKMNYIVTSVVRNQNNNIEIIYEKPRKRKLQTKVYTIGRIVDYRMLETIVVTIAHL